MAITDKIVTKERLAYFKGKLDTMLTAWTVKSVKRNGTTLTPDANGAVNVITAEIAIHNHNDPQGGMDKIIDDVNIRGTTTESGAVGGSLSFYENIYNTDLITMHVEGSQVSDGVLHKYLTTQEYVDGAITAAGGQANVIESIRYGGVSGYDATIGANDKKAKLAYAAYGKAMSNSSNKPVASIFAEAPTPISGAENVEMVVRSDVDNLNFVEINVYQSGGSSDVSSEKQVTTKTYVDNKIQTEIAAAKSGAFVKVADYASLPVEGEVSKIYLVPNSGSGQNVYDEYIWCVVAMMAGGGGGESPVYGYEKIGTTAVDLTGYVREEDLVEITTAEIDAMFA